MDFDNRVHLWVGTNLESDEKYLEYFELDPRDIDIDDPEYRVCEFCKDIGEVWYDQDFIGIIPRSETEIDLDEILLEAAVDEDEKDKVKKICIENGITKANAIFWYQDPEIEIPRPYKADYNGLKYIGMFDGD